MVIMAKVYRKTGHASFVDVRNSYFGFCKSLNKKAFQIGRP
jgi:hypothetical protein